MNSYYTVHIYIYIYLENNILTERVGIRILTCDSKPNPFVFTHSIEKGYDFTNKIKLREPDPITTRLTAEGETQLVILH